MRFEHGTVVQTTGGRVGIVSGHIRHAAILVPLSRKVSPHRSNVRLAGRIEWSEPTASLAGVAVVRYPYWWPESLLAEVGRAAADLMADILRAQANEVMAHDDPPTTLGREVDEDFQTVTKTALGLPDRMAA